MALRDNMTSPSTIATLGAILLMGSYGLGAISLPIALGGAFIIGLAVRFLNRIFFANSKKPSNRIPMNVVAPPPIANPVRNKRAKRAKAQPPIPAPKDEEHKDEEPKPQPVLDESVQRFDNIKQLEKLSQNPLIDVLVRFMATFHHIFSACVTKENKEIFGNEFNNYFSLDGKELLEILDGIEFTPVYQANNDKLKDAILDKIHEMLTNYRANPRSSKTVIFNANTANADLTNKVTESVGAVVANMLFFEQGKRIHECATLEEKRKEMLKFTQAILLSKDVQETIAALSKPSIDVLNHEIVQQKGGNQVKAWIEAAQQNQDELAAKRRIKP